MTSPTLPEKGIDALVREHLTNDDAAWALTCAFLILTMQTGFAMLECGSVSMKNVANIMIKNVVDVSLGGLTYWAFGYGLSFGKPSNWFMGTGGFFFTAPEVDSMGSDYSHYFFQFSFATTATTIVSGAVAERMSFHAYMAFSMLNTFSYCFPASWAWNRGESDWTPGASFANQTGGFLYRLGYFDFAGVSVVHATGGVSALVAASMLGPRKGRFENPDNFQMSSPVTALTGMFMLWWAWLGFNCGSTFGVSGHLWKLAALVAVTTLNGAIGGGVAGLSMSMARNRGKVLVDYVINSILGGLVGVTGIAAVIKPPEALAIGAVGGAFAIVGMAITRKLKIDDPVGAIPVHCFAAIWGTLAVGLFGRDDGFGTLRGLSGLVHGGGWTLLGVQTLGLTVVMLWSSITTLLMLLAIKVTIGLRMSDDEEVLGADWCEHRIKPEVDPATLEHLLRKASAENSQSTSLKNMCSELMRVQKISSGAGVQDHRNRVFAMDRRQSQFNATPSVHFNLIKSISQLNGRISPDGGSSSIKNHRSASASSAGSTRRLINESASSDVIRHRKTSSVRHKTPPTPSPQVYTMPGSIDSESTPGQKIEDEPGAFVDKGMYSSRFRSGAAAPGEQCAPAEHLVDLIFWRLVLRSNRQRRSRRAENVGQTG